MIEKYAKLNASTPIEANIAGRVMEELTTQYLYQHHHF